MTIILGHNILFVGVIYQILLRIFTNRKIENLIMEKPEELVQKLNELLESDHFDRTEFYFLIKLLKEQFKTDIKFFDFEYYNEERMESARSNKITREKLKDFEAACIFREEERECQKYIEIKTEYNIRKSAFYYEKDYLFYFCLGTAKNDKIVRDYLKK